MTMFITFEGGEGSGKTTAIRAVAAALRAQGLPVYTYAEPGSTAIGHKLREILLYQSVSPQEQITARAELLLFCASRAQFTETVLKPLLALQSLNPIVLCDRYADSTLAYQLYGRGLPWFEVYSAVNLSMNGILPDLTFFFDIAPDQALTRLRETRRNRLDAEDLAFHERVYRGYQALNDREPKRWRRIDATESAEQVAASVTHLTLEQYQEKVSS